MRKDFIRSMIIVGLIVVFSISSTYAFMYYSANSDDSSGTGGCFQVSYEGTAVNNVAVIAGDAYSDDGVSAHPIVKLSKASSCKIYTEASIYLSVNESSQIPLVQSNPASGAFKYKVMNGSTEVASGVINKSNDDILLGTVPLSNTVTTYDIYLWIDQTISNGAYDELSFSGKIYAQSVQSSGIKS